MPFGRTDAQLTHSLRGTLEPPRFRLQIQVCRTAKARVGRKCSVKGRVCEAFFQMMNEILPYVIFYRNNSLKILGSVLASPVKKGRLFRKSGRWPAFRGIIACCSFRLILKISKFKTVCSRRIFPQKTKNGPMKPAFLSLCVLLDVLPELTRPSLLSNTDRSGCHIVRRPNLARPKEFDRRLPQKPGQKRRPSGCRRPLGSVRIRSRVHRR